MKNIYLKCRFRKEDYYRLFQPIIDRLYTFYPFLQGCTFRLPGILSSAEMNKVDIALIFLLKDILIYPSGHKAKREFLNHKVVLKCWIIRKCGGCNSSAEVHPRGATPPPRQGQQVCFVEAAMKRYHMSKVRETKVRHKHWERASEGRQTEITITDN